MQSSHTWDNSGLTAVLSMEIRYLTTESDFQLIATLHQSSTKSRVLLCVFQVPCNVLRYIAASLKGNVLPFFFFTLSIKMLLVENLFNVKKRKIKIDTYPRSFNYCINCSWRCCGCPYYKFMRWISLMCFWEAQHERCTRNVLHESRDKQNVANSGTWAKAGMGGWGLLAVPKNQRKNGRTEKSKK